MLVAFRARKLRPEPRSSCPVKTFEDLNSIASIPGTIDKPPEILQRSQTKRRHLRLESLARLSLRQPNIAAAALIKDGEKNYLKPELPSESSLDQIDVKLAPKGDVRIVHEATVEVNAVDPSQETQLSSEIFAISKGSEVVPLRRIGQNCYVAPEIEVLADLKREFYLKLKWRLEDFLQHLPLQDRRISLECVSACTSLDRSQVQPTILFLCLNDDQQKLILGGLRKRDLVPPQFRCQVTVQEISFGSPGINMHWSPGSISGQVVEATISGDSSTLCGVHSRVLGTSFAMPECTLGGLIRVGGSVYALTTGHTLVGKGGGSRTIDGSKRFEPIGNVHSYRFTESIDSLDGERPQGLYDQDWALVRVQPILFRENRFIMPGRKEVTLIEGHIQDSELHHGSVLVLSSLSGVRQGYLTGSMVSLVLGQSCFEVRSIALDSELASGDSGSWVVRDSKLCGYIIAITPGQPWAYMLPIAPVFRGISDAFSVDGLVSVEVPSQLKLDNLRKTTLSLKSQNHLTDQRGPTPNQQETSIYTSVSTSADTRVVAGTCRCYASDAICDESRHSLRSRHEVDCPYRLDGLPSEIKTSIDRGISANHRLMEPSGPVHGEVLENDEPESILELAAGATGQSSHAVHETDETGSAPEPVPIIYQDHTSGEYAMEFAVEELVKEIGEHDDGAFKIESAQNEIEFRSQIQDKGASHLSSINDPEKGSQKGNENAEISQDPNIVRWETNDPEKPLNWPSSAKISNISLVIIMSFVDGLASLMIAPGVPELTKLFQNSKPELSSFVVSIYVLRYAASPLLLQPMSDIYGCLPVYHSCNIFFLAFTLACAVSKKLNDLILFRFFAGVFGNVALAIGARTTVELMGPKNSNIGIGLLAIASLFGAIVGPVVGGFVAERAGWPWVFWLLSIATGLVSLFSFLFMRETSAVTILAKKTRRLQKETGNPSLRSELDTGLSPKDIMLRAVVRPAKMLCLSPILYGMTFYLGAIYGFLYIILTTFATVFEDTYNFSTGKLGLSFLGLGVGSMLSPILFILGLDRTIRRLIKGAPPSSIPQEPAFLPEHQLGPILLASCLVPAGFLMYGWTVQRETHWIFPIIGTGIIAIGCEGVILGGSAYLNHVFTIHAGNAIAAATVIRAIIGAILPLAGQQLYKRLGLGWGNSLLAFVAIALLPVPWGLLFYGRKLRKRFPTVMF